MSLFQNWVVKFDLIAGFYCLLDGLKEEINIFQKMQKTSKLVQLMESYIEFKLVYQNLIGLLMYYTLYHTMVRLIDANDAISGKQVCKHNTDRLCKDVQSCARIIHTIVPQLACLNNGRFHDDFHTWSFSTLLFFFC